ncbi:MAG: hypothetical protein JW395_2352 [Nitrospira sp.]|nr:hypothetical protein [Nitrospira sp.]
MNVVCPGIPLPDPYLCHLERQTDSKERLGEFIGSFGDHAFQVFLMMPILLTGDLQGIRHDVKGVGKIGHFVS